MFSEATGNKLNGVWLSVEVGVNIDYGLPSELMISDINTL